jgi:hypothetical protein
MGNLLLIPFAFMEIPCRVHKAFRAPHPAPWRFCNCGQGKLPDPHGSVISATSCRSSDDFRNRDKSSVGGTESLCDKFGALGEAFDNKPL